MLRQYTQFPNTNIYYYEDFPVAQLDQRRCTSTYRASANYNHRSGTRRVKWKQHYQGQDADKPGFGRVSDVQTKTDTFENVQPEEFLVIFNNFKIAINGRRTTSVVVRINYLHMVIRGEALIRFDELARHNNGITCAHLEHIMEGLLGYFSPINALSKQKRVMCRAIYKPRDLPFKSFTAQLKELNYYLPLFLYQ